MYHNISEHNRQRTRTIVENIPYPPPDNRTRIAVRVAEVALAFSFLWMIGLSLISLTGFPA